MELGATICLPRDPRCKECPVQRQCLARQRNITGELPNLSERTKATARRFVAFVVEHKKRFLVRRRAAGLVNGGLWEWPNVECAAEGDLKVAELAGMLGLKLIEEKPLAVIRHSITRYRMELRAYHAQALPLSKAALAEQAWCTLAELDELAFSSAHRRIVGKLDQSK